MPLNIFSLNSEICCILYKMTQVWKPTFVLRKCEWCSTFWLIINEMYVWYIFVCYGMVFCNIMMNAWNTVLGRVANFGATYLSPCIHTILNEGNIKVYGKYVNFGIQTLTSIRCTVFLYIINFNKLYQKLMMLLKVKAHLHWALCHVATHIWYLHTIQHFTDDWRHHVIKLGTVNTNKLAVRTSYTTLYAEYLLRVDTIVTTYVSGRYGWSGTTKKGDVEYVVYYVSKYLKPKQTPESVWSLYVQCIYDLRGALGKGTNYLLFVAHYYIGTSHIA